MAKSPDLGTGVLFWASLIEVGLLLIGDDGPDVADEEPRGPEGKADTPGEGCWENWVLSWFCFCQPILPLSTIKVEAAKCFRPSAVLARVASVVLPRRP